MERYGLFARSRIGSWCCGLSGWQRYSAECGEDSGQGVGPGPALGQAQEGASAGSGPARAGMQEPVADCLPFGFGQGPGLIIVIGQEHALVPGQGHVKV